MTDHKPWLWRRKSSEKLTIVSEKECLPSQSNEEEVHILLSEKAELERDLKDMSDKLSFAISECNANNELANENAKMAQDALAGWEKSEAKALSLKEELEEALERRAAYEERTIQLEAALKECMQQLRFVREEKEQRINDVLSKLAKDYDEKKLIFEEKVSESNTKIAELQSEISKLSEIIFLKEKMVEELNQKADNSNADLKELLTKLESTEKHNTSLKYEVQVLEKELHIRNEERDFNRQASSATHKLHLENVKKIATLESECQRLRVLMRKRLPGPASMTRMKNEVETLIRSPAKKMNTLVDKLHALEEENNALKENLEKKTDALQISRNMYAHASLKLKQAETQLEELSKAYNLKSADFGCDDKVSCAWSSASTMISELTEKGICTRSPISNPRSSEISLMDDFLEMEKLAVASTSGYHGAIPLLQIQSNLKEEIGKLKEKIEELEFTKKEVEENYKNKKLENEDLNTQLSVSKIHLDDASEKLLSLQAESEYKTKQCEELKVRCNELQIQLQSATTMDVEEVHSNEDEKQLQTNWDVTAASEKLAKCQETIFSLGKQLKAMSDCQETTSKEKSPSLLDKMLAEDHNESPQTKEMACSTPEPLKPPPGFLKGSINPTFESDWNGQSLKEAGFGALPIVAIKKKQKNAGLLKKLIWRKRKGKFNKLALALSTC